MNIVLFESHEIDRPLPRSDRRALHLLDVLRRRHGDSFDAGLIDGPRGKGTLVSIDDASLLLRFEWHEPPLPLHPVTLVLGLPRPQTARKVLQEATSLGVESMHFVTTQRGEPGYVRSTLWTGGEWRRHLIAGAEQAFCTRLPCLTWGRSLAEVIEALPASGCRLALDNYEAAMALSRAEVEAPVVLALGPEPGWSDEDRAALRAHGFTLVHLGSRVLRTETAVVAAVSLVLAKLSVGP